MRILPEASPLAAKQDETVDEGYDSSHDSLTDVKARRRIFGNVNSAGMLGVHISNSWILKIVVNFLFSR
jgi:hypothetical protein